MSEEIPEPTGPTGTCWDSKCIAQSVLPLQNAYPEPFHRCPRNAGEAGPAGWQLSPARTKSERQSDPGTCCYLQNRACECPSGMCGGGRALTIDGVAEVASTEARTDWMAELEFDFASIEDDQRTTLAVYWSAQAQMEHASIASFARLSLELLALGAPADLVQDTASAMADEIAHARAAYAIASHLRGEALGPAPFSVAVAPIAPPTLASLAVASIVDGCLGETVGALVAEDEALSSEFSTIREVSRTIAEEETRHAELAFRIVAWAVGAGGPAVENAVLDAIHAMSIRVLSELEVRARDHIVVPCLRELLRCGRVCSESLRQSGSFDRNAKERSIEPLPPSIGEA